MILLLACAEPEPSLPPSSAGDPMVVDDGTFATAWALEAGSLRVTREVRLDRGRFLDGEWVSEPGEDPVRLGPDPIAGPVALRWHDTLRVDRSCGPVDVPVVLDATPVVSAPYPACGARPTGTIGELEAVQRLGLFTAVPTLGADDEPAGYFTWEEAEAWCAWWGGQLPVSSDQPGWLAVRGEAWLGEPRSLAPGARLPELGVHCGFGE